MIIGLTGGIASGKSTVSNFFKELGVKVIDADIVAREISERKATIDKICNIFGRDILDENGRIVREKLRERVFQDKRLVQKLNSIIHPQVIEYFKERKDENREDELLIFDVPLLYEAKMDTLCDKVIVVGVDRKKQIERVIQRDGSSEEVARNIIANQMSLDDKIKRADIVIMNDGTLEELKGKVLKVYKELREVIK
ncbi:dephospho-CoA kinase [uncultured Fusobacterium sp.]|uniref:dephospho-CoA kinase n=1 Tax=uncultured Fusobacterium sp. TaxID=159267 RepID=UPI0025D47D6C|nr:dephospho-CoA kinase [uncultured Fusobacterium sp.]